MQIISLLLLKLGFRVSKVMREPVLKFKFLSTVWSKLFIHSRSFRFVSKRTTVISNRITGRNAHSLRTIDDDFYQELDDVFCNFHPLLPTNMGRREVALHLNSKMLKKFQDIFVFLFFPCNLYYKKNH